MSKPKPEPARHSIPLGGIIGRLVGALRCLEEQASIGRSPNPGTAAFLRRLDHSLTDEERGYVAMAFACQKDARDELTALLVCSLQLERGVVIAAIRWHLEDRTKVKVPTNRSSEFIAAAERLRSLRACVVDKVARVDQISRREAR